MTTVQTPAENHPIATILENWYSANYRDLPWRKTKKPYSIWLSEIILQQTRVSQGLPYYERFIETFEDISAFASASETEILKLWQGLGYYSRARNMHSCAKTIVTDYNGEFPNNYSQLLKLKGIGKYTAAAIASICFHEAVPAVDGNVYRVFSRVFGIENDISHSATFKVFFELGKKIISRDNPGDFNQAVMELGALVCKPKKPDCPNCVLREHCYAYSNGDQMAYPVKTKKIKIRNRFFHYLVFRSTDQVLMRRRSDQDVWGGLFDFYLIENDQQKIDLHETIQSLLDCPWQLDQTHSPIKHLLTHQRLNIDFSSITISDHGLKSLQKKLDMQIVDLSEIHKFAVCKPIESFLKNDFLRLN